MSKEQKLFRTKVHRLVDRFNDEELTGVWETMWGLYCDRMMLKAIQAAKNHQQPWDVLTHEEAVRFLG
ncbi:hypothetical protein [Calothrix sp. NIES-3974]|uniref:hypothetical protein n=1 Tax=Calothrix sp. NIES-3974 TaxID=2005462 RepID=UPI000BBC6602|nr:hypothetical protein [Calothrix sp. NIES-3974]